MTLSLCSEMRYTANAKSSVFSLPGVLILWRLYNHRCLNYAKQPPNNKLANSGWRRVFAAFTNSMRRCARSHAHGHHNASREYDACSNSFLSQSSLSLCQFTCFPTCFSVKPFLFCRLFRSLFYIFETEKRL